MPQIPHAVCAHLSPHRMVLCVKCSECVCAQNVDDWPSSVRTTDPFEEAWAGDLNRRHICHALQLNKIARATRSRNPFEFVVCILSSAGRLRHVCVCVCVKRPTEENADVGHPPNREAPLIRTIRLHRLYSNMLRHTKPTRNMSICINLTKQLSGNIDNIQCTQLTTNQTREITMRATPKQPIWPFIYYH